MRMSRSDMELNLLSLLSDGVISTAELDGFSEELREKLTFVLRVIETGTMATVEQALARLQRSAFRAKFHLSEQDRQYIADKGMETIQRHAADFIRTRLGTGQASPMTASRRRCAGIRCLRPARLRLLLPRMSA